MITNNQAVMNPQYGYAVKPTRPMGKHSCWRVTVIVMVFFIYLAAVVLSSLNSIPRDLIGDLGGLYERRLTSEEDISDHSLEPPPWVFWIVWPVTYTWCLLWMIYALSTLCRSSYVGSYLYVDPPYMPITLYVGFTLANMFGVAWTFLWDRNYTWIALIALAMMALFNIVGLAASMYNLYKHKAELKAINKGQEIGWVIGLVHNGLAMYAAWTCIATLLNLIVVLIVDIGIDDFTSCIVALSILSFEVLLWFTLDNFVFWRATKYTFTPYIVVCLALTGVTIEHWDIDSTLTIFTVTLLGFSGVFFMVKIILSCARSDRMMEKPFEPLYAREPEPMIMAKQAPQQMVFAQAEPQPMMMKQAEPQSFVISQMPSVQPAVYSVQQPVVQSMVQRPAVQYLHTNPATVRYSQRPAIAAPPPATRAEPLYMTQRMVKPTYYY